MDISVVICTYNRAGVLARCLDCLAVQNAGDGIAWEAVVVDNGSTDSTRAVAERYTNDRRIPGFRVLREARQGVAHARRRGVRETGGRLVAFVDDDCFLAPDWIANAVQFARAHPRAGAFGGRNVLMWDAAPSAIAKLYAGSLAAQDWGDRPQRLPDRGRACPVGAGLVVDRAAAMASGWIDDGVLVGRCGNLLSAGEDSEIVLRIRHAGREIWYTPTLELRHFIAAERTTLDYLRRLHRGFGAAEPFLRALARAATPRFRDRLASAGWALGETARVLARWPRGYVQYADERPTWLIRISYARGCLEGAARYVLTGRA